MKKVAFFQALVIVILISVSWIILLLRFKDAPAQQPPIVDPDDIKNTQQQSNEPAIIQNSAAPVPPSDSIGAVENKDLIPPAWSEWIDYLAQQNTVADMRSALQAMRETISSMEPDQARARLIELISSGVNVRTGLRFQLARDGSLLGAPDLQTLLIDWLYQTDPTFAADFAKSNLVRLGEELGPDAYVLQLRNYTLGTTDQPATRDQFVRKYFDRLISNPAWTADPVHSIAESMDFAVYLGDGSLVTPLSRFMAEGQAPGLRHASSMATERLVDIDPVGAMSAMLSSINQSGMPAGARAGYAARLDPANPQELNLLTEYLRNPAVSQGEALTFLQSFPNLNKTFSPNLVSPQFPITELGDHMQRLRSAVNAIHSWQSSPVRPDIASALSMAEQRLMSQIRGEPTP